MKEENMKNSSSGDHCSGGYPPAPQGLRQQPRSLYVVPAEPGPSHLEAAARLHAAAVLLEYSACGRLGPELATVGALALMGGALEHLEAVA
jgi:hypothetical protein